MYGLSGATCFFLYDVSRVVCESMVIRMLRWEIQISMNFIIYNHFYRL